ncbi:hypothetical protein [Amycolatopsis sp. NPDC051903]|uniref:hypothetical protein n=1 Tax=Amycolatopsis sp. NPDC051903 TaxID=3363936 RepID=UPI0037A7835F
MLVPSAVDLQPFGLPFDHMVRTLSLGVFLMFHELGGSGQRNARQRRAQTHQPLGRRVHRVRPDAAGERTGRPLATKPRVNTSIEAGSGRSSAASSTPSSPASADRLDADARVATGHDSGRAGQVDARERDGRGRRSRETGSEEMLK